MLPADGATIAEVAMAHNHRYSSIGNVQVPVLCGIGFVVWFRMCVLGTSRPKGEEIDESVIH